MQGQVQVMQGGQVLQLWCILILNCNPSCNIWHQLQSSTCKWAKVGEHGQYICIIHYESCIFKQYYVPGKFSHISPQRIHSCHKWDNCCIWAKGLVVEAAIPSDWVLQKVEHRLLQIQVPYLLAALYAKYALILSFPSQNCALFLVLCGLFTFSSSMCQVLPSQFLGQQTLTIWERIFVFRMW